uniref:Transmembrane protein n=1 Tax=Mycena chlorophos TaxID=658473 RepID=A0ABQ0KYT2_MYCCL|nr:predicted protein [Mycena chlorophos]
MREKRKGFAARCIVDFPCSRVFFRLALLLLRVHLTVLDISIFLIVYIWHLALTSGVPCLRAHALESPALHLVTCSPSPSGHRVKNAPSKLYEAHP